LFLDNQVQQLGGKLTEKLQRHHKYHPRRSYKTRIEKTFRSLPCQIEMLTAEAHRLRHKLEPNGTPGGKPRKEVMIRAIKNHEGGTCMCQNLSL
jgi:predicted ester cyclase